MLVLCLLGAGLVVLLAASGTEAPEWLHGRGNILALGEMDRRLPELPGTTWHRAASSSELLRSLHQGSEERFHNALAEQGLDGVLVLHERASLGEHSRNGTRDSVEQRLRRRELFSSLRGLGLSRTQSLYLRRLPLELEEPSREVLATVARGILTGMQAPQLSSFPAKLRQHRNVEVMLRIRTRGRDRLWRSARGDSIAEALLVASTASAQRWHARASSLGEPLAEALEEAEVEVSLLEEDGELHPGSASDCARLLSPEHGLGLAFLGRWEYRLPGMRRARAGTDDECASLLGELGLDLESLAASRARLYRFRVDLLGVSPPPNPLRRDAVLSAGG